LNAILVENDDKKKGARRTLKIFNLIFVLLHVFRIFDEQNLAVLLDQFGADSLDFGKVFRAFEWPVLLAVLHNRFGLFLTNAIDIGGQGFGIRGIDIDPVLILTGAANRLKDNASRVESAMDLSKVFIARLLSLKVESEMALLSPATR